MNKEQILKDLTKKYPLVAGYKYWIITSPLTYPSMSIDPRKELDKYDIQRFIDIDFAETTVYQCDGVGGSNSNESSNLSDYTELPVLKTDKYNVEYVFDCTNIGTIYKEIECSEKNYSAKISHEIMLSRRNYNLHYEEPCIVIKKELV